METHPNLNFAELVDGLCRAKNIKKGELAHIIGYDRKIVTKIGTGYIPPKPTVIAMGTALGLNIAQMKLFIQFAGYILCPIIPEDAAYIEVITKIGRSGSRRIDECNEVLKKKGFKLLGNLS